jgi:hypothetical protein
MQQYSQQQDAGADRNGRRLIGHDTAVMNAKSDYHRRR